MLKAFLNVVGSSCGCRGCDCKKKEEVKPSREAEIGFVYTRADEV